MARYPPQPSLHLCLLPWRQENSAKIDDPQDSKQGCRTQLPSALLPSNIYDDSIVLTQTGLRPSIGYTTLYQIAAPVSNSTALLPGRISFFSLGKADSDRFSVFQVKILCLSPSGFRLLSWKQILSTGSTMRFRSLLWNAKAEY